MYNADAPSPRRRPTNRRLYSLNLGHGETGCRHLRSKSPYNLVPGLFLDCYIRSPGSGTIPSNPRYFVHGRKTEPCSRCRRETTVRGPPCPQAGRPASRPLVISNRRPSPARRVSRGDGTQGRMGDKDGQGLTASRPAYQSANRCVSFCLRPRACVRRSESPRHAARQSSLSIQTSSPNAQRTGSPLVSIRSPPQTERSLVMAGREEDMANREC